MNTDKILIQLIRVYYTKVYCIKLLQITYIMTVKFEILTKSVACVSFADWKVFFSSLQISFSDSSNLLLVGLIPVMRG